jgi:hypothetical protein
MRTRQKKKVRRTRRGGRYYYPYNTKPIIFTNDSNAKRLMGGFVQNLFQRAAYGIQESSNASNGHYPQPYKNPYPLVQPISSSYKV